jgi:hypothetical protein
LIFVIILIVFTARFVNNPCLCYGVLCNIKPWDTYANYFIGQGNTNWVYGCTTRTYQKLPVLKGLLSCAVLLLVSNIVVIAVYLAVFIWLSAKPKSYVAKQSTELPPYPVMYPSDQYQSPVHPSDQFQSPVHPSDQYQSPVHPSDQYQTPIHPTASLPEHYYYVSEGEIIPNGNPPRESVTMRSEKF